MPANRTRATLIGALIGVVCAGLISPMLSLPARAEGVEIEGMASAPYSSGLFSGRADEKTRQQVLLQAEYDALGRYAANFSTAKYKLYQGAERDIKAHIEDYISQPTVIDEGYKKAESKYFIVIRTTINTNRLEAELNGSPDRGAAQAAPQRKIAISFPVRCAFHKLGQIIRRSRNKRRGQQRGEIGETVAGSVRRPRQIFFVLSGHDGPHDRWKHRPPGGSGQLCRIVSRGHERVDVAGLLR